MNELYVEKTGNVVSISGNTEWKNAGIMEVELFTLPEGCRPNYRGRSFVSHISTGGGPNGGFCIFTIETSGKCILKYMSCDGYPIIDSTFVCA